MPRKKAKLSPEAQLYVAEWRVRECLAHNTIAAITKGRVPMADQRKLRSAYDRRAELEMKVRGNSIMSDAQRALARVQETQTDFWSALSELESVTGLDIDDSSIDFEGMTVEDVIEYFEEGDEDEGY